MMKKLIRLSLVLFLGFNVASHAQSATISDEGREASQNSDNRFYNSIEDFINNKPLTAAIVQTGSFGDAAFGGKNFRLFDGSGKAKRVSNKDLPAPILTYKRSHVSEAYLIRMVDDEPYVILSLGKLTFYALLDDQEKRYTSDGWNGELKRFKGSYFEDYLEKYHLLQAYKNDKPKREFRDDVNGYFNKYVNWQVKYFDLLNEKLR